MFKSEYYDTNCLHLNAEVEKCKFCFPIKSNDCAHSNSNMPKC